MIEIWKSIKGYEGLYEVSNTGKVRSLDRVINGRVYRGVVLKPSLKRTGYVQVILHNGSQPKKYMNVHRLVAEAFLDNPDNLPEVNHIDGNKQNNHVDNLEWCSKHDNAIHAYQNGLRGKGENHYLTTLTEDNVKYIKSHYIPYHSEFGCTALAREFGVKPVTISAIIHGRNWKGVV